MVNFPAFLHLLLLPLLMYFATAILCPEPLSDQPGSLEGYFGERAKIFYLVVMAILVVGALQGIFFWNQPYPATILRAVAALLVLLGFFVSARPFHSWLAIILLVLFVIYVYGAEHFPHPV